MANFKSIIINGTAAVVAVLFLIGAANMDWIPNLVHNINAHTSTGMAVFYYVVGFSVFFLFPIISGAALEVTMWESNTRIGSAFANAMSNARDSVVSFIAFGLFGGTILFFAMWGVAFLICTN